MGCNSKKFDKEAHYASKSTRELEELLKNAKDFVQKNPKFEQGMHNEYMHSLKSLIASRVGEK